jgi:hypothetical protein
MLACLLACWPSSATVSAPAAPEQANSPTLARPGQRTVTGRATADDRPRCP